MPSDVQFNANDIIINAVPEFFEKLEAVLSSTPNEVKANYLMWRVAASAVSYLPKVFRDRQQNYTRITTGREEADPRELTCANLVLSYFPHALGSLYVRRHFDESAKANVNEMVDNIMVAFKEVLDEIDWMDPNTKVGARGKADTMKAQMAYADELRDDSKLIEYYNTLGYQNVDENSYYESVLSLGKSSTFYSLGRLRQPVDKNEWPAFVAPAIVNAFYSSLENTIKFPAGILQGAFFNPNRPHYMNYGGIGYVIGHEITHGFDDQGKKFPLHLKIFSNLFKKIN
jgi:predicted metalloendopeptidase